MKTMTNNEIYNSANTLIREFDSKEQTFPVKVNFYLQKNKGTLTTLAQEIEKARLEILQKYGTLDEETNQFQFSEDTMSSVMNELNELLSIEQEVNIYCVKIDDFNEDFTLTTGQMEALMFMID